MYCYPIYPYYPGYCKAYYHPYWYDNSYNYNYDCNDEYDYHDGASPYTEDNKKCGHDKVEMIKKLMAVQFCLVELNLYLDTHPKDGKAIRKYNEYLKDYTKLKQKYQQKYGPLTALEKSRCPWEYIKGPWPWDIEYK